MILIVANANSPTITSGGSARSPGGKIAPGEPLSLPLRGEGIFNSGDVPMNDGDMDVEDDGQPSEYDEWQDVHGGDDWDHGQFDEF